MLNNKINLLAVARWPLGGIRTYMRYVYKYLPHGKYQITILAPSTQEDDALRRDTDETGARLIIGEPENSKKLLYKRVFIELRSGQYDLIQSHGFISAAHVYLPNLFFRVPHILTVHGILEERLLSGLTGRLKMTATAWVIKNVDVLYAVSNDILAHLHEHIPSLARSRCRKVVIPNGIDVGEFGLCNSPKGAFRQGLGIGNDIYLMGFLGRFMPQKGFNYLIDAMEMLEARSTLSREYLVLAVGSGDYLDWYKKIVKEKKLGHRFYFIPFQKDVAAIYRDIDVVVMPSIWEASGLQAMEALCSGTPLIVSDCIGLRETVKGTPAVVFESKNPKALAGAIYKMIENPMKEIFAEFRNTALKKYDVRHTARELHRIIENMAGSKQEVRK